MSCHMPPTQMQKIMIIVLDSSKETQYEILYNSPDVFSIVLELFLSMSMSMTKTRTRTKTEESARLFYRGRQIEATDTANELGMSTGDRVEVQYSY